MIENLIPKDAPRELTDSYKLRSRFWTTSVLAHIVWIFIATQIHLEPKPLRPVYDEFIRPLERKVLIYRPPVKRAEATPETPVGKSIDPRAAAKSLRTIIATVPEAKSLKQVVIKPIKLPEINIDVPSPNVVAHIEAALPPPPPKIQAKQFTAPIRSQQVVPRSTEVSASLPDAPSVTASVNNPVSRTVLPPPKFQAKQFTAPTRSQQAAPRTTEVSASLPDAPTVTASVNNPVSRTALPPAPKVAPKQFVAPPPSTREPRLATPTEVSETLAAAQAVTVPQSGGAAIPNAGLAAIPKAPAKQFKAPAASGVGQPQQARATEVNPTLAAAPTVSVAAGGPSIPSLVASRLPAPPPRDLPPAATPARGNAPTTIAAASVNPNPAAEVPANSRSGQISVAPLTGEPSSGAPSPSAIVVPNLTLREPIAPPNAPAAQSNTVIYSEKVRSGATGAFAVPLRPANRSVPRAVDARFAGRSVYTVLIPIENLPAYGGDWVLWFAEMAPLTNQTPSIRAPVPYKKLELLQKARESTDTRLQISATLGVDGKLRDAKVLSNVQTAIQEIAMEDLTSWEWKPATRNGTPIEIQGVFEIPFRLPQKQ